MCMKLHVRVVEATDVPKMDLFGKADPYCCLTCGTTNVIQKTKVCSNTYNPVWNQEFHFDVTSQATDMLYVSMKDRDRGMSDDPISKKSIPLNTLVIGNVYDKWHDMEPYKGVKKGGRLRLVLHLASSSAIPFQQITPQMSMYNAGPVMSPPPMYPQYGMQPMYSQYGMQQMMPPQPMMGQPMYAPQPQMMGQSMYPQQPMMQQPTLMGQPQMAPTMMGQPMYQPQPPMMGQPMYPPPPMMQQPTLMGQPQMGQPMMGQHMMGRPY